MHRFYAPDSASSDGRVHLAADETHHLRDVLRRSPGDTVHVFDGKGSEYLCRIDAISKHETILEIIGTVVPVAESSLDLTLASVVMRGEKYELIIQKAVELGVTHFIPLLSARCEVRLKDVERRSSRWQMIARDAAKQCGRATEMSIGGISTAAEFVNSAGTEMGTNVMFAERGGENFESIKTARHMTAMIGPKGGWDDSELQAAIDAGFTIITLGGRIMRAETAAISIVAILQHRFGDLN